MHQDAYIFRRVGTGMPQVSEHIKSTILNCGAPDDPKQLERILKGVWEELLKTVYPKIFSNDPPDIDKWHRRCYTILEKLLPTSSRFVGFARHACDGLGFLYPTPDEIKNTYIENLKVPAPEKSGQHMHYDDIFNFAIEKIQKVWLDVTRQALGLGDFIAFRREEWNLDTGKNELDEAKGPVFWRVA